MVAARHTLWVSASRAIWQPSRSDSRLVVEVATFPRNNGGFGVVELIGNPNRKAERRHDFEAGYRTQVSKRVSFRPKSRQTRSSVLIPLRRGSCPQSRL